MISISLWGTRTAGHFMRNGNLVNNKKKLLSNVNCNVKSNDESQTIKQQNG